MVDALNEREEITTVLGENKIFPLIAPTDTQYPYVIYERLMVSTQYTKIPGHDNTVQIQFRVYSDKYDEALTIANTIRNVLERHTLRIPNIITINDIRLAATSEQYTADGYLETVTFLTMVE